MPKTSAEPLPGISELDAVEVDALWHELSEKHTFRGDLTRDEEAILRLIHTMSVRVRAANKIGRQQARAEIRGAILGALGVRERRRGF